MKFLEELSEIGITTQYSYISSFQTTAKALLDPEQCQSLRITEILVHEDSVTPVFGGNKHFCLGNTLIANDIETLRESILTLINEEYISIKEKIEQEIKNINLIRSLRRGLFLSSKNQDTRLINEKAKITYIENFANNTIDIEFVVTPLPTTWDDKKLPLPIDTTFGQVWDGVFKSAQFEIHPTTARSLEITQDRHDDATFEVSYISNKGESITTLPLTDTQFSGTEVPYGASNVRLFTSVINAKKSIEQLISQLTVKIQQA
jgi:hypothetical protein